MEILIRFSFQRRSGRDPDTRAEGSIGTDQERIWRCKPHTHAWAWRGKPKTRARASRGKPKTRAWASKLRRGKPKTCPRASRGRPKTCAWTSRGRPKSRAWASRGKPKSRAWASRGKPKSRAWACWGERKGERGWEKWSPIRDSEVDRSMSLSGTLHNRKIAYKLHKETQSKVQMGWATMASVPSCPKRSRRCVQERYQMALYECEGYFLHRWYFQDGDAPQRNLCP